MCVRVRGACNNGLTCLRCGLNELSKIVLIHNGTVIATVLNELKRQNN